MLSPKENYYQAAKGLNPDRYANQYEALRLVMHPALLHLNGARPGQENVVNAWGITNSWPEGMPGAFPVHTPDKIVIQDIEHWQDYVHAPSTDFPDEEWEMFRKILDTVDDNLAYKTPFVAPGIFEQCHHLGEIQNTMINLYEYEDEMHDLIKYITEYELKLAEGICKNLKPNALFHHDDWGSRTSTFMSPEMFEDFFVEPYKEVYGYYKSHGVELIVHHSDSYGATLVPSMIEMGIDVWQGCMSSNDLPNLTRKYCGQIGFMGGFDGADFDYEDWTREDIRAKVFKLLDACTPKAFIPCIAQGGPGSIYDGVYDTITEAIDDYNVEHFGIKKEEIQRAPIQYEKIGLHSPSYNWRKMNHRIISWEYEGKYIWGLTAQITYNTLQILKNASKDSSHK